MLFVLIYYMFVFFIYILSSPSTCLIWCFSLLMFIICVTNTYPINLLRAIPQWTPKSIAEILNPKTNTNIVINNNYATLVNLMSNSYGKQKGEIQFTCSKEEMKNLTNAND